MPKCSFCGGSIPESRGKMFVKTDGRIFWYCNSKCEKNARLKRVGKKVGWTQTFRKEKGKDKAQDST